MHTRLARAHTIAQKLEGKYGKPSTSAFPDGVLVSQRGLACYTLAVKSNPGGNLVNRRVSTSSPRPRLTQSAVFAGG
jgi:hypothetical protein